MTRLRTHVLPSAALLVASGCIDLGDPADASLAEDGGLAPVEDAADPTAVTRPVQPESDGGLGGLSDHDPVDGGPGIKVPPLVPTERPQSERDTARVDDAAVASGELPPRQEVFYLSHCTLEGRRNSEVSWYADRTLSRAGERPDRVGVASDGSFRVWEHQDTELALSDGTDFAATIVEPDEPAGEIEGVGLTYYAYYACYQDSPRELYRAGGKQCQSVYYCTYDSLSEEPQPADKRLVDAEVEKLAALVARALMSELRLTRIQASAIVGSLVRASYLNANWRAKPGRVELGPPSTDPQEGAGWGQWRGGRKQAYLEHARAAQLDPTSPAASYSFLLRELTGSQAKALEALKRENTLEQAVLRFAEDYGYDVTLDQDGRLLAAQITARLI